MACLFAIEQLGWPLDRIVTADVWATDDIPADPPEMVEFKAKADTIIKERWGIDVEHTYAQKNGEKLTYEKLFYHKPKRKATSKWAAEMPSSPPPTRRIDYRIPLPESPVVQRSPQTPSSTGSPSRRVAGARNSNTGSSSDSSRWQHGTILGFPMRGANWCTSSLKTQPLRGRKYFPVAPHEGRI